LYLFDRYSVPVRPGCLSLQHHGQNPVARLRLFCLACCMKTGFLVETNRRGVLGMHLEPETREARAFAISQIPGHQNRAETFVA